MNTNDEHGNPENRSVASATRRGRTARKVADGGGSRAAAPGEGANRRALAAGGRAALPADGERGPVLLAGGREPANRSFSRTSACRCRARLRRCSSSGVGTRTTQSAS